MGHRSLACRVSGSGIVLPLCLSGGSWTAFAWMALGLVSRKLLGSWLPVHVPDRCMRMDCCYAFPRGPCTTQIRGVILGMLSLCQVLCVSMWKGACNWVIMTFYRLDIAVAIDAGPSATIVAKGETHQRSLPALTTAHKLPEDFKTFKNQCPRISRLSRIWS